MASYFRGVVARAVVLAAVIAVGVLAVARVLPDWSAVAVGAGLPLLIALLLSGLEDFEDAAAAPDVSVADRVVRLPDSPEAEPLPGRWGTAWGRGLTP